ncbi:DUF2207 domain-containing protein [Clostridium sp. D53t1_180928_C8]|uniref:DUF2207 domain-containing protein n=1 Tax=Clostridium sp. D53t1_180928_C8 TaxID=2787101 RepID=UPI0018AA1750|nr:DUF2207 domain-containing protein [Clostridium sp. D53t1_180928_C8]
MRKLLVILSLVFMLIAPTSVYGTSREYFIDKLNVEAVILDNGDVVVNEIMDYRFNGQFNGVYRNLALIGTEEYVINSVSIIDEDGNVIEAVEDYSEENNTYEIDEDFERTQIKLFCKSNNESKKIQLNYTIKAAALRYLDYSELYWNFYNVENIESVKEGNIKISLKDTEFDENVLYYDIYGEGEIETTHTKDYINISFKNLTTLIGIDMKFQSGYLSNVEESEFHDKENIIDEYEYYYDKDYPLDDFDNIDQHYYQKEDNSEVIGFLILAAIVIGGISTIFIFSSNQSKFEEEVSEYRKNNIITKYEIIMEPPSDLPPALVNLLINEKVVSKEMLNVTLFYLANKGYYTIEEKINDSDKDENDLFFIRRNYNNKTGYKHLDYILTWFSDYEVNGSFSMKQIKGLVSSESEANKFINNLNRWIGEIKHEASEKEFYIRIRNKDVLTNRWFNEKSRWISYKNYLKNVYSINDLDNSLLSDLTIIYASALEVSDNDLKNIINLVTSTEGRKIDSFSSIEYMYMNNYILYATIFNDISHRADNIVNPITSAPDSFDTTSTGGGFFGGGDFTGGGGGDSGAF